jgi:single-strand DNA-binding protein
MRSLNRVELIGRLGADPDIRHTQAGDAVATLSIATSEQWKDKTTGEPREDTEWHRCVLWRRLAEIAGQYLQKGARVYIAGHLKTRKWTDNTGQDRYTTEIQTRDLIMLDGRQHATPHQDNGQRPVNTASFQQQAPSDFDDDIPF